ncbi:hypothetical protein TCAL_12852, partial [Tigriopus californicus]|eukprot:TCALIF_12852-PA protein Name:"Similar to Slmap Sarcolemmal membrane-associated protein (Rattus norvegicus)" AED:0.00 eAED:0.00 QI:10/1/0/1/0/0.5/2/0/420
MHKRMECSTKVKRRFVDFLPSSAEIKEYPTSSSIAKMAPSSTTVPTFNSTEVEEDLSIGSNNQNKANICNAPQSYPCEQAENNELTNGDLRGRNERFAFHSNRKINAENRNVTFATKSQVRTTTQHGQYIDFEQNVETLSSTSSSSSSSSPKEGSDEEDDAIRAHARVILESISEGFEFRKRTLILKTPQLVGRRDIKNINIGDKTPCPDNALFNCRVLSKQHAMFIYKEGSTQFILRDLHSSNGTFVNGKQIEPGEGCEIFSNDIIQFGQNVRERGGEDDECSSSNNTNIHFCIVARAHLFFPLRRIIQKKRDCSTGEMLSLVHARLNDESCLPFKFFGRETQPLPCCSYHNHQSRKKTRPGLSSQKVRMMNNKRNESQQAKKMLTGLADKAMTQNDIPTDGTDFAQEICDDCARDEMH